MIEKMGFKRVEFEQHKYQTVKFESQVNKTSNPEKQTLDVVISNNFFCEYMLNILFKEE